MQAVSSVIAVAIAKDHYIKLVENMIKNAKCFAENKENYYRMLLSAWPLLRMSACDKCGGKYELKSHNVISCSVV